MRVINLPGPRAAYEDRLVQLFDELRRCWESRAVRVSEITSDETRAEWSLPSSEGTRLVYFAVPLEMQAFYREFAFPIVLGEGLVPVTAEDLGLARNQFLLRWTPCLPGLRRQ